MVPFIDVLDLITHDLALTSTYNHTKSYQNAQFSQDGSEVQREQMRSRLSVAKSPWKKGTAQYYSRLNDMCIRMKRSWRTQTTMEHQNITAICMLCTENLAISCLC